MWFQKSIIKKFMSKMLGDANVEQLTNSKKYNDTNCKLLKVFDLECATKSEEIKFYNVIKSKINADIERYNFKGIDSFDVKHCARYVSFTNKQIILSEEKNKGYTLHAIYNGHSNDYDYFNPILEEIDTNDLIRPAFCFFANRKYDSKNIYATLITKYK